jgi:hypothetical protein
VLRRSSTINPRIGTAAQTCHKIQSLNPKQS